MPKRATIQDVAREAGVSVTTVSRYLNGRYESMSDRTREKIADVIARLGYRPNALAKGLKAQRTQTVGAIVVNMGYPFCVGFLRAFSRALGAEGYHLMVAESEGDARRERQLIESLVANRVEAIALQTSGANNDYLEDLAREMPVVLVDRAFSLPHAYAIGTNNRDASREMAWQLFDLGYERIVYLTEDERGIPTRTERLEGYLEACRVALREPEVMRVRRGDASSFADAIARVDAEIRRGRRTAVYSANGLILMECYRALRQLGHPVPSALGLATFDHPDWADLVDPPLTCVRQPVDEMGEEAARMVIARLRGEDVPEKTRVLASTLVMRESTGREQSARIGRDVSR
ncbi:LacI family DNA-binding transcriptional regulator [Alicyclobacillus fructus]|uniref:LacI family DNA-binding transcriptional regulator n=1 Tax=Alicyclobacillus fructus TaxID=2816082 RepID=UPI001A9006E7|nr:LacI family DNA-binding transcriptional regulator [Alicyclobacillus fructus]